MTAFIIIAVAVFIVLFINRDKKVKEPSLKDALKQDLALHSLLTSLPLTSNISAEVKTRPTANFVSITTERLENEMSDQYKATGSVFKSLHSNGTTPLPINNPIEDSSIIDINKAYNAVPLNSESLIIPDNRRVVPWHHQYVYSFDALHSATPAQKEFYEEFKNNFLLGKYLSLNNNSNYAFVLMFDLYNEYEQKKDLQHTEYLLEALAINYPATKAYTIRLFLKKLQTISDWQAYYSISQRHNIQAAYNYDENYWRLGTKFKTKLGLKPAEVEALNKLGYVSNAFCNIEKCFIQVIRVYLSVIVNLEKRNIEKGTTFAKVLKSITDPIIKKQSHYSIGEYSYNYSVEEVERDLLDNIFKRCENFVREAYHHKRKLNLDLQLLTKGDPQQFQEEIAEPVAEILEQIKSMIEAPDETTQIELNCQNTTRWKHQFETVSQNFKKGETASYKSYPNFKGVIEDTFKDKNICVKGKVEEYRGKAQIIVEKPEDIIIL